MKSLEAVISLRFARGYNRRVDCQKT
jgi:hypothetical protein